ncbi:unnamed protein product [Blepharisma stoltei]|uniref:Uncharacterized protein n=1 Tax=Blepharisma stoltei TaxID=1481888 RepID=A0AAU9J5U4_9CILI|nr:unnamed protein product [Blepharisma stoltei]
MKLSAMSSRFGISGFSGSKKTLGKNNWAISGGTNGGSCPSVSKVSRSPANELGSNIIRIYYKKSFFTSTLVI